MDLYLCDEVDQRVERHRAGLTGRGMEMRNSIKGANMRQPRGLRIRLLSLLSALILCAIEVAAAQSSLKLAGKGMMQSALHRREIESHPDSGLNG